MSDHAPEQQAVQELQTLVHHLADELAAFRRRALLAEAKLKESDHPTGPHTDAAHRIAELEQVNEQLKAQLAAVASRATQMLERVRFMRQQVQDGVAGGGR